MFSSCNVLQVFMDRREKKKHAYAKIHCCTGDLFQTKTLPSSLLSCIFLPQLSGLGILEPRLLEDCSGSGQLPHSLFQM